MQSIQAKHGWQNIHDNVILNLLTPSPQVPNQISYYVCGVVESKSNSHPHNNVAALIAVVYAIANVSNTHVIIACSLFWQPVEAIIATGSGFNELCI